MKLAPGLRFRKYVLLHKAPWSSVSVAFVVASGTIDATFMEIPCKHRLIGLAEHQTTPCYYTSNVSRATWLLWLLLLI